MRALLGVTLASHLRNAAIAQTEARIAAGRGGRHYDAQGVARFCVSVL
jgi:hypothetical protein